MLSHPIRSSLLSPYAAQAKTTYQNLEREEKRKRREYLRLHRGDMLRLRMYYMRLKIGDRRYDIGDTR